MITFSLLSTEIPDRTVLEIRGKKKDFYWRHTYNNEKEMILLTNRPGSRKGQFCGKDSKIIHIITYIATKLLIAAVTCVCQLLC